MHKHKAKTEEIRCFAVPAKGAKSENPSAHGGACFVEVCACGAVRETNSNGRHTERGTWQAPTRP